MEQIGDIASVITLVSFVFYLIGKCITIFINKKIRSEYFKIERYDDGSEAFRVVSQQPINWYKIYEVEYNQNSFKKKKYGKLITEEFDIKNGHLINVDLPCGIPNKILVFERYDYMKGKVLLQNPGKDGIIRTGEGMSHTVKSILFYLVK